MNYEDALKYIHSINWTFCKPGLDRISELCEKLGNPERKLRFIHIAGTNGKGSTSSMLASVLSEAGYKVGLYTSPYIYRFNERMRVNGKDIPDSTLTDITEFVKPIADAMADKPTEFELITAIAFEYFMREGCDVVVLEAGMGGRLDSTNVIRNPLLSVITGISLDHTSFLGDTVEAIAYEKAGIIKDRAPILFGGSSDEAYRAISEVAEKQNSELYTVNYNELQIKSAELSGSIFDYKDRKNLEIKLLGLYQPRNASIVCEAVDILNTRGLNISEAALRSGLSKALWRARFEIINKEPTVIFDGAHNPEGIYAAVESIIEYFGKRRVVVLSGVLADKDFRAIAQDISRVASHAFTITPDNPRALSADKYAEVLSEYGVLATPSHNISDALKLGMKSASENNTALVCLGSLYTYVDIIKELEK